MAGALSASDLARALGVSPPRVSQYVSEGKLEGCYTGTGRNRRFDLVKAAAALGKRLDPGQMMGNGSGTKRALERLQAGDSAPLPLPLPRRTGMGAGASELDQADSDRYELARIVKAEEEARRIRRQNAQEEGQYVLAAEVESQVARVLAQEMAETEGMLRAAARSVADRLGVDARAVLQVLTETWRAHRTHRAEVLQAEAETADMSPAEAEADI